MFHQKSMFNWIMSVGSILFIHLNLPRISTKNHPQRTPTSPKKSKVRSLCRGEHRGWEPLAGCESSKRPMEKNGKLERVIWMFSSWWFQTCHSNIFYFPYLWFPTLGVQKVARWVVSNIFYFQDGCLMGVLKFPGLLKIYPGWWFQICCYFHPENWGRWTHFDYIFNIFQLGWNHQLVFVSEVPPTNGTRGPVVWIPIGSPKMKGIGILRAIPDES